MHRLVKLCFVSTTATSMLTTGAAVQDASLGQAGHTLSVSITQACFVRSVNHPVFRRFVFWAVSFFANWRRVNPAALSLNFISLFQVCIKLNWPSPHVGNTLSTTFSEAAQTGRKPLHHPASRQFGLIYLCQISNICVKSHIFVSNLIYLLQGYH